jgi:hypothetical protein
MNMWTWIGFFLSILAYITYILSMTAHGKRPPRSSWIVFLISNSIIVCSMASEGAVTAPALAYELGILAIVILSFWKGRAGWTPTDKRVLAIAIIAAASFPLAPKAALVIAFAAAYVGTIPLWQALMRSPDAEPQIAWLLFFCGSICEYVSMGPVSGWKFSAALGTTAYAAQQLSVVILSMRSPKPRPA